MRKSQIITISIFLILLFIITGCVKNKGLPEQEKITGNLSDCEKALEYVNNLGGELKSCSDIWFVYYIGTERYEKRFIEIE